MKCKDCGNEMLPIGKVEDEKIVECCVCINCLGENWIEAVYDNGKPLDDTVR